MLNKPVNFLFFWSIKNRFAKKELIKNNVQKISNLLNFELELKPKKIEHCDVQNAWNQITNYLFRKKIVKNTLELDILKDEIASLMIGDAEWISGVFYSFKNSQKAMEWFETLSKFTTYIKLERTKKNEYFKYKNLEITINNLKPEKTPEQIKAQSKIKDNNSVLSNSQVGKRGNLSQPPRMAHRIIYLPINQKKWFIQYSPYQYFPKHSILISEKITPMKVNKSAISTMLDFVDYLPTFNISLNADIPIVGGSILNHMHFQCGQKEFPLYNANKKTISGSLSLHKVVWPISTFLVKSKNKKFVLNKIDQIVQMWKNFQDSTFPKILGKNNNSCSLTLFKKNNEYYFFVLLRNNSTSNKNPSGIFHVPESLQPIKKENIGIIEAMGTAILPGRLNWKDVNLKDKLYEKWIKHYHLPKSQREYHELLGKSFEEILIHCDPFRLLDNYDVFEKQIGKDNF